MIVLKQFATQPDVCQYLPDQTSQLLYEVVATLSPAEYEERMNAGWRKFGRYLFRPVCASCRECRPVRILINEFAPDRSQRRCSQRNADLEVRFARPAVDDERLALYNRYHAMQANNKGWQETEKTADGYAESFLHNPLRTGVEVTAWEGSVLQAVALTEVTPDTISGVYHYHEPEERERGLGVFVMLQTIELARHLGKPYAYFGYYVAGCPSLNYKTRFRPCEVRNDAGEWERFRA